MPNLLWRRSVLDELRALWEANLLKSDVCRGSDPVAAAM